MISSKHQLTQTHLSLADQVFRIRAVIVPDLEQQVEILDKDEPDTEVFNPFRVQIVVDNFSFTVIIIAG